MIVLSVNLDKIYGFDDFTLDLTYPRKIVDSLIEDEFLEGRERFRYKRAVVLMGSNATGKTSLGRALLRIFRFMETGVITHLLEMASSAAGERASFCMDFVNEGYVLHRLSGEINTDPESVVISYATAPIDKMDSYEKCVRKLKDHTEDLNGNPNFLKKLIGPISYRFAYPEIEPALGFSGVNKKELLKTLRAVIGTLDPTLTDISLSRDLKDSFIIRRKGAEIIIQDGKLLNREALSSGTAEGIDVAIFLASMLSGERTFYYCDEHFSYIQSDIEKRIFGLMLDRTSPGSQLIFTTHNTDMLDLNLPKHAFVFLRKKQDEDGEYKVTAVSASEILKRNTDSVRCAVENDVFDSLPDDSLLDDLEMGWADE